MWYCDPVVVYFEYCSLVRRMAQLNRFLCFSVMIFCTAVMLSNFSAATYGEEVAEQLRKPFWTQGRQVRKAFARATEHQQMWAVSLFSGEEVVALGAIVDADGWIVTKASQISDAKLCELDDGRRLPFEYIGFDIKLDLALLKIDVDKLPNVQWETDDPQLGEWVISVRPSEIPVGVGVVSVHRRKIPATKVHGVLGIQMELVDAAIIERIFPNSGAEAAGLVSEDRVLKVNETRIQGRQHLIRTIGTFRPGDTIIMEILREEKTLSVSATLTHPFGDFLSRISFQEQMGGPLSFRRDGFEAVFQHDTVLKPEDCGGPVINLDGKAIGINIARAGRTSSYILPADLIIGRIDELKTGEFPPPIVQEKEAPAEDSPEEESFETTEPEATS